MPAKPNKEDKPLICRCTCPFCEAEIAVAAPPFCTVCKVSFGRCPDCGAIIVEKDAFQCQSCGKQLK